MRMLVLAISAAVLGAACGGSGPSSGSGGTATPSASVAATPTAVPTLGRPTATTPPELRGKWGTRVSGDSVVLTLDGDGYTIRRGTDVATGHITVTATEITFDSSSLCEGEGRYRWSIADERLRFEEIEPDVCGGRTEVLIGVVFGNRSDP